MTTRTTGRRLIALSGALVLAATMTACSSKSNSNPSAGGSTSAACADYTNYDNLKGKTVTVYTGLVPPEDALLKATWAPFERCTGAKSKGEFDKSFEAQILVRAKAGNLPDIAIVPQSGPEVIMGSSRMKSGTAQKLILNTISTAVMIRLGRVYSNLMIDMPATNEKLRSRAVRMVELAAGVTRPVATQALRDAGGNVRLAAVMAKRKVPADAARKLLEENSGNLREVLGA